MERESGTRALVWLYTYSYMMFFSWYCARAGIMVELTTQEILAAHVLVVGSSSVRHDSLNRDNFNEVVVFQNETQGFNPKFQPLSQSPPPLTPE